MGICVTILHGECDWKYGKLSTHLPMIGGMMVLLPATGLLAMFH